MATSAGAIKAGAAYVEIGADDSKLRRVFLASQKRVAAFGAALVSVGSRLTGVGALLTTPFIGAAKLFANMGSEMLDMSTRTGLSVETLSELSYAAGQTGVAMEHLEIAMKEMVKNGIPTSDFQRVAEEINSLPFHTQRAQKAMEIFGTKTGTKLLPLIAEVKALSQEARDLGIVMTTKQAKAADVLGDRLDTLWKVVKMGVFEIGGALAPALSLTTRLLVNGINVVRKFIKENEQLVVIAAAVTLGITALGIALTAVGLVAKIAAAGIGVLAFAFSILSIKKIASIALWGVWTAATLVAKGAVWLFNAAITVMNLLLAGNVIAVGALVLVVGTLGAGLVVAGAAAYGAFKAASAFIGALGQLGSAASGPIAHIGDMFKEWWTILGKIVQVAKVDMKLAWEIAGAGAALAVSQVKDVFPPLWKFLGDGFAAIAKFIGETFVAEFSNAIMTMLGLFKMLKPFRNVPVIGSLYDAARELRPEFKEPPELKLPNFVAPTESAETKAARDRLNKLLVKGEAAVAHDTLKHYLRIGQGLGTAILGAGNPLATLLQSIARPLPTVGPSLAGEAKATFNPFGVRGLGADTIDKQQLNVQSQMLTQLKGIKQNTGKGSGGWWW